MKLVRWVTESIVLVDLLFVLFLVTVGERLRRRHRSRVLERFDGARTIVAKPASATRVLVAVSVTGDEIRAA